MSARLSLASLDQARAARPDYDVKGLRTGIVHLGLGAFHRAHQAVFTEDAIRAAGGDWGIVGVSLRSEDAAAALAPQDHLYTVETLSAVGGLRVVGALRQALSPKDGADSILDAIAAPETRVITLTVTEKAYRLGSDGMLDLDHPEIAHDLARPAAPQSAIGWLAEGLARRHARGGAPVTVISCDNLMGNGRKLEAAVHAMAERWNAALARWIAASVAFPQTMVDCIVPATTDQSRARIAVALGLDDAACVSREAFAQWVIEDRFAGPRPAWERAGVEFSDDIARHERLKLHVLNAAHSSLAYLGLPRGLAFIREAIADPVLSSFADAMMADEVAPALAELPVADYWRSCRARFANPRLDHRLAQIAEDGSSKLAQRLYPLIIANARAGRPTTRMVAVVRAWRDLAAKGRVKDPQADRVKGSAFDDPALFPEPFRTDPAVRAALSEAA